MCEQSTCTLCPASASASASLTSRGLIEGCPGVIKQIFAITIHDQEASIFQQTVARLPFSSPQPDGTYVLEPRRLGCDQCPVQAFVAVNNYTIAKLGLCDPTALAAINIPDATKR